jgi:hypothetical protein
MATAGEGPEDLFASQNVSGDLGSTSIPAAFLQVMVELRAT